MKNLGKIAMMFLLGLSCVNFVACSDEENTEETSVVPVTVNPSNVFVNGLPKEAEGLTFIYNTDGLLTSISEKEGSDRVSFDYSTLNQSKIQMVIYDSYGTYILDMTIGDNGFVSDCVESGPYGNDTWSFGYTASEQLNYMKRSEGGNEITTITYQEGDIVHVGIVSEGEAWEASRDVKYTSGDVASPMPNKGCVMLFDNTFGVDMDEMKYAYYAGLLGKATKNLPIELIDHGMTGTGYDDVSKFKWTLNQDGLPTQLDITEQSGYTRKMIFQW